MTATETRTSVQVHDDLLEAADRFRELRATPDTRRGDTWEADRRSAAQAVQELNTEFDMACRVERYEIERAAWEHAIANPPRPESRGPGAAFADTGSEYRTPGEQFVESDAYGQRDGGRISEVEVRNLLTSTSDGTSGSNLFVPAGTPTLNNIRRRRLFVRDLLGVQPTSLASVPYIRELNAATLETGAATVKEASAKPEVTMTFERDDAPIRKIAGWLQVTDEALSDAVTLRGYIDNRLGYMVMVEEEEQVLGGNGTSPNIKGIRSFTIQTQGSTEFYEGVGVSIGKIENVDGDADGVVANPLDYWAAVVDRHSTFFDGAVNGGGGGSPFTSPAPTVWGLPVVRSRSIESGKALVGAFGLGATLFQKEGITLRSTDSHASLFTSNTVVILAEERVGLAVHRPDFFCELTVAAPS